MNPMEYNRDGHLFSLTSLRYQNFVYLGIKAESPLKAIKGQWFLDQENFIEKIKHLTRCKERLKEIPRESYLTRPPLKEIFKPKDQKSKGKVMYKATYSMAIP